MTISSEQNRVSYSGNGSTVEFNVPFRFIEQGDISVIVVVDATGESTTKVLDTDYTVAGEGDEAGGTVTFLTSEEMGETDAVLPPQTGESVVVFSDPPLTQLVDYIAGGPLPAESHEEALDRAVLQQKRTREMVSRSLRLPDSDPTTVDPEIPGKVDRASMILGFDSNGDPTLFASSDPAFSTFTANRALQTDGGGNPEASSVTAAQLATLPDKLEAADVSGTARVYTAQQNFGLVTLTDAATIAWDLSVAQSAEVTIESTGRALNITNVVNGGTYILHVVQGTGGSKTITDYNVGADVVWPDDTAPELSTAVGSETVLTFVGRGGKLRGAAAGPFSS